MKYRVEYTQQAVEDLKSLSRTVRSLLYGWIEKNLADCEDPRRHGTGDPEGGRWRYQIGEYRILAEIQEDRIIILTVLAGLRRTANLKNSGKTKLSLSSNVFLRSTLRQPVKTTLLLAVLALITFAFVSRAAEYLLIKQETERLGSYYRTIGTLESAVGDPWADISEAVDYLENNPYVDFVDTYKFTSGVIQDGFCNADSDLDKLFQISDSNGWFVFCGTLKDYNDTYAHFVVDTVLAGKPEYITEGLSVILHCTESLDIPARQLISGERYIAAGYYAPPFSFREYAETGELTGTHVHLLHVENNFYHLPEGQEPDWSDPGLETLSAFINEVREEQAALNVIVTKDMSAMPSVQGTNPDIYLTEGRWLDRRDNKSCVIQAGFAASRGLAVGDTITLKLRDILSIFGYFGIGPTPGEVETATCTFEIAGIYDYMEKYTSTAARNSVYIPASAVPESFSLTTMKRLGRVGIDLLDELYFQAYTSRPSVSLPYLLGVDSFVLNSPEATEAFLYESREVMSQLGFRISLIDNGWEAFQAAAAPMRKSSLLNALFFSALLVVVFCLAAVIYYHMRRKEIAIARALGVPVRNCVRNVSVPLLLLGFLGISAGGLLGWRYTLNHAGSILQALAEFGGGTAAGLSIFWSAALLGAAFLTLVLVTAGGASVLSSRPVLVLMQGGTLTAQKENREPVQNTAAVSAVFAAQPVTAMSRTERPAASANQRYIFRFVLRHVTRSKLKSGLAVLLAVGFTAGLAAIQLSIAGSQKKIDWLYENTPVEAELVQADPRQTIRSSGFIRLDTIEALLQSGYITDAYLEGAANGAVVPYEPSMEDMQAVHISKGEAISKTVRALGDEKTFLSAAGSGGAVTITYFDGWDGSLFAEDWPEGQFPVVLPKTVYTEFGNKIALSCKGFHVCEVAGYYEGEAAGEYGETDPVLIPLSAYQHINSRLVYSKAHVTLNPSLNRELEAFTQILTELSGSQHGAAALRALIWDEELRLAVAPLENSIKLMRVLYPVTLVLSLLVAAGLAVLFVMTSAREAAIMRVLGTSRLRSSVMLAFQTALTSTAGLLMGLLGILLYIRRTQPELLAGLLGASGLCAALYLSAAVLGSAVSASILTGRNPLELLQVKE